MKVLLDVVQYIIALGAAVFLPIIMTLLGLLFGLKLKHAIKSGLMFGIAFVSVNLFISQLLVGQIAPIAQEMIKSTGLQLTAIDVGWSAASMISWAWPYAAIIFPIQIGLNILFLIMGWTKTLIVDLWNVWFKIFTAAVCFFFTGNMWLSFAAAILMMAIEFKIGDYMAPSVQETSGIPDVTVPHMGMGFILPLMPLVYLLDQIPALNKEVMDAKGLKDKLGILGDPVVIGAIIGLALGLLSKSSIQTTLTLAINVSAVILVLPRLASIFSEALQPISEAASNFMKKRFPGKEVYIGLDWPILAGIESLITSSMLLIPVLVLLAVVLPGNKVLPFGDIGSFAAILIAPAVLSRGDLRKTFILGIPILTMALYGSSAVSTSFTQLAVSVGYKMPEGATQIAWLKTSPLVWCLFSFLQQNYWIAIPLVLLSALGMYILKKYYYEPAIKSKI